MASRFRSSTSTGLSATSRRQTSLGARIIVLEAPEESPTRHIGLLAAGVTDTVAIGEVEELNLNLYLPMIYSLIPPAVAGA